jgi:PPOX class probable F420-dependent enzyme
MSSAREKGDPVSHIPESHADLLEVEVATLATVGHDGYPQVTAIWFLYDEGKIKLSLNTSRQKVRNLRKEPACTLFIMDPDSDYRYLEVRADAHIEPDPDYVFADKLGKKYDADLRVHDKPGQSRVVITLEPHRVNAIKMR